MAMQNFRKLIMCFIIYIIFNTKFYPRFSPKQAHTSFSSMKLNFVQLFLQSHSILQSTLFLTMFSKSGLLDGQSIVRISFSTLATRDVLWIIVLLQTPVLAIHLLSSRQQICLQYTYIKRPIHYIRCSNIKVFFPFWNPPCHYFLVIGESVFRHSYATDWLYFEKDRMLSRQWIWFGPNCPVSVPVPKLFVTQYADEWALASYEV